MILDKGRFPFNQNFRKFGNSGKCSLRKHPFLLALRRWGREKRMFSQATANGTEISRISSQKFRKLLNFPKVNHSTENSRSEVEWKENVWEKIFDNIMFYRFWKFWNMLFHWLLEVAECSKRTFWLNGKRPIHILSVEIRIKGDMSGYLPSF